MSAKSLVCVEESEMATSACLSRISIEDPRLLVCDLAALGGKEGGRRGQSRKERKR